MLLLFVVNIVSLSDIVNTSQITAAATVGIVSLRCSLGRITRASLVNGQHDTDSRGFGGGGQPSHLQTIENMAVVDEDSLRFFLLRVLSLPPVF